VHQSHSKTLFLVKHLQITNLKVVAVVLDRFSVRQLRAVQLLPLTKTNLPRDSAQLLLRRQVGQGLDPVLLSLNQHQARLLCSASHKTSRVQELSLAKPNRIKTAYFNQVKTSLSSNKGHYSASQFRISNPHCL
jgi:hypothetical protein